MSNLTTKQFPASVPEVPEKTQDKNLETIVSNLDTELQELKKFLKTKNRDSEFKKEPSSPVRMAPVRDGASEDADASPSAESHPLKNNRVSFAVTPLEAQSIVERLKNFHQEGKNMERLARVERQNRRLIIIGSIFGTLMVMFMVVFAFLAMQDNTRNRISLMQVAPGLISAKAVDKDSPHRETPTKSPEIPAAAATEAPQPAETPSLARDTTTPPASDGSYMVASTPKEPVAPPIKYVGSVTSNKYHYPECKWAKTIIPKKVRGFTSVAEAKKVGYIRCPTCKPHLTDAIDSQVTMRR